MHIPEHLKTRQLRAEALKEARKSQHIDKKTLSDRSGVSRFTIDRIESGRASWTVDTEIILMRTLGLVAFQPVYGEEAGKIVIVKMMLMPAK